MVETQEIEASRGHPQIHQRGLGRSQGQAQLSQYLGQCRQRRLGPFPGRREDHQIVREADDLPQSGVLLTPSAIQLVQHHIGHQGTDDAANAMGNFCFDVTLGYRLSEKSRHWQPRATDDM